jgi:hypothetical protein
MQQVMLDFKSWCGILSVHGATDYTHIQISKPKYFPKDYYREDIQLSHKQ